MHSFRKAKSGWTTADQTTFAKWVKAVCVFYGALVLLLFAGLGVYVTDSAQTTTTAAVISAPTTR
jgi:hypothetical protein